MNFLYIEYLNMLFIFDISPSSKNKKNQNQIFYEQIKYVYIFNSVNPNSNLLSIINRNFIFFI